MKLEALKIFCEAARCGSFSKTAKTFNVTQSNVSQHIHSLEKQLGLPLINRKRRPWVLTLEGKLYSEELHDIIRNYERLERKVRNFEKSGNALIKVGAIYSVGLRYMRKRIKEFSIIHKYVDAKLEYLHPDRIQEKILSDDIDVGIVSYPEKNNNLSLIPWRKEEMVLVSSANSKLSLKKYIKPEIINSLDFVGFDGELRIKKEVDKFLKRNGVKINIVIEFDNIEAIKMAIEEEDGLSILPFSTVEREIQDGRLKAFYFKDRDFYRPLAIIYKKDKLLSKAVTDFIDLLKG